MERRRLGTTDLSVSVLGIGGSQLARLPQDSVSNLLLRALELGVNLIETAAFYGESEEKIGRALGSAQKGIALTTKPLARSRDEAERDVRRSLERLRTDHIVLYQHAYVQDRETLQRILEPGGAHEGLVLARGAGWIGEIGISRHRSPVLVEALRASGFAAVQVPLNPVERHAEAGPLPLARSAGVGVIAMKALGAGTLRHPRACLRYVLAQDVTAAVVGVGRLSELEEDASAVLDLRLPTAEEHEELKAERQRVGVYACQRYGACQACPEGIRPLEALFWALGMARKRGVADVGEDVRETVHGLGLSRCSGCGVCESLCPNGLPIRRAIREAAALFGAEPPLGGSSPP